MKIGFSACSLSKQGLDTTLDLVRKAGYDAIELSGIGSEVADDEKQVKLIVDKVADAGLVVEALRGQGVGAIEVTSALGAPLLATGINAREGDKQAFEKQIKVFRKASKEAADCGVRMCIKPHVGNYVHSTPTIMEFLEKVDSKQVGVMWDPSHLWRADENPDETLAQVKDHIFAVRLRDHKSREKSVDPAEIQVPGNGFINFESIMSQLTAIEGLDILVVEINNWGTRKPDGSWD